MKKRKNKERKKKKEEKNLLNFLIFISIILSIAIGINLSKLNDNNNNKKTTLQNNKIYTNPIKQIEISNTIDLFLKSIKENPEDDNNYAELGWAYYEIGNYEKSKNMFSKSIEINPNNDYGLLGLARHYSDNGNFNVSEKYFNKLENLRIKDSLYYHEYGRFLRSQLMFEKALKLLNEGLKLYPDDEIILNELGLLYYSLNKYTLAEKYFIKSIEINNPTYICPYEGLGLVYFKKKNLNKAIENMNKSIEMNLEFYEMSKIYNLANKYLKEGNIKSAIELIEKQQTNPYDSKIISMRDEKIFSKNKSFEYYIEGQKNYHYDFKKSEELFKKSIEVNSSFNKPYLMLYHYYFIIENNNEEAKNIAKLYIKNFPTDTIGSTILSLTLLDENLITEAKKRSEIISKNVDNYDISYLNLGILHYKLGEYEKGDIMFEKALITKNTIYIDGPNPYFQIEKIDKILSTLINFKRYEKAKLIINQILNEEVQYNVFPLQEGNKITLYNHLANIHIKNGDYKNAEKILLNIEKEFIEKKDPGLDCPYQSLGLLYFKTNNLSKSKEYYIKYANLTPYRFSSQLNAANSCFISNDLNCSIYFVNKALEIDQNDSIANELLKKLSK
ncbi:tetratricopeptide repeat protein [archaeon]|jgi:tetratricopeptide (TPR) repeat protein|nr:tetratricopeptide repeat protein [Candidatus Woesearchaeota archaeon]MBT4351464.1 tetratricopeptide repeat protein [archaeon]MBT4647543.1 tetratricopeptide repeat protein [archaeon]MBT6821961.1 tetratricopeptide repeat protein [archaeon]